MKPLRAECKLAAGSKTELADTAGETSGWWYSGVTARIVGFGGRLERKDVRRLLIEARSMPREDESAAKV